MANSTATSDVAVRAGLGRPFRRLWAASVVSNVGDGIGLVAYPWLASAVTRNPLLISLVFVVQRLPWLLFSLPVGVMTDRSSRRDLMIASNVVRATITAVVAIAVLTRSGSLAAPNDVVDTVMGTSDVWLYVLVLTASFLLGTAEVGYDTAAQTILPDLVDEADLEKANGRLIGTERVANAFIGPPLGGVLLAIGFAVPFVVDAATFAVSAALIALIPRQPRPAKSTKTFRSELIDGVKWVWRHDLFRPMSLSAGFVNGLNAMQFAIYVLFAQEVLGTSTTEFALLGTSLAVGALIGGVAGPWISERIGASRSLTLPTLVNGVAMILAGLMSSWLAVWAFFSVYVMMTLLFVVVSTTLRQSIVPTDLLGRVNSVGRFFSWGAVPIGAVLGGVLVSVLELVVSRDNALRAPYLIEGTLFLVIHVWTRRRLTPAAIAEARRGAA